MKPSTRGDTRDAIMSKRPRGNVRETLVVDDHLKRIYGKCLAHAEGDSPEVHLRIPTPFRMADAITNGCPSSQGPSFVRCQTREARTSNNTGKKTHGVHGLAGKSLAKAADLRCERGLARQGNALCIISVCGEARLEKPSYFNPIAVLRVSAA